MTTFLYSVQQAKSPLIPKDTGDFAFVLLLNSGGAQDGIHSGGIEGSP